MANEIQKFDPATIVGKLRDRIRDSIADLIPQEQWDGMLKKEVDEFFKDTGNRWNYKPSHFAMVVNEELTRIVREQLQGYLSKPEYQPVWKSFGSDPGEAVKQLAIEAGPAIMQSILVSALQDFITGVRNKLAGG